MKHELNEILFNLSNIFSTSNISIAGRANVFLYSIFSDLKKDTQIVFPAIMCPSPLIVAKMAGCKPLLCDVDDRGIINIESLKNLISSFNDIKAVLAVNLFGQNSCTQELYNLCQSNNILLIEDAALGWSFEDISRYADYTILSFGSKKPIDSGSGGACFFKNQDMLKKIDNKILSLKLKDPKNNLALAEAYSKTYYALQCLNEIKPGAMNLFSQLQDFFFDLYLVEIEKDKLPIINSNIFKIRERALEGVHNCFKYQKYFESHPNFSTFMDFTSTSMIWRYCVSYEGSRRNELLIDLRKNGIDVSSWYPSLAKLGFNQFITNTKNADSFGDKVMNFWIYDISEDYLFNTFRILDRYKE